jgi:hypothetical protein
MGLQWVNITIGRRRDRIGRKSGIAAVVVIIIIIIIIIIPFKNYQKLYSM